MSSVDNAFDDVTDGQMTLSEKLKELATSRATDEDRLQVLIHLTAELAQKIEPPPVEFCDICPHALAFHNPDGSCGCGMDCANERRKRAK